MNNDSAGANSETDGYHLILSAFLVKVGGQGPRRRIRVVRLDGSTAPAGVAISTAEKIFVACDNRDHDGVVDKPTEHSAIYLRQEHDTRRNFD